jgi:cobalamin-dependent methionine synthase I
VEVFLRPYNKRKYVSITSLMTSNSSTGKFVEKLMETEARILGLSGFLTPAFDVMKETVQAQLVLVGFKSTVNIRPIILIAAQTKKAT